MNTEDYKKLVTRTEARIEKVKVPEPLYTEALNCLIAAGNILDQIKKHNFYGSEYNLSKYKYTIGELVEQLSEAVQELKQNGYLSVPPNPVEHVEIPVNTRLYHSMIGNITEATETAEILLDYSKTGQIDLVHFGEEKFDDQWYLYLGLDEANINYHNMMKVGFDKLKGRYPDKFNQKDAEERDLQVEREILNNLSNSVD